VSEKSRHVQNVTGAAELKFDKKRRMGV